MKLSLMLRVLGVVLSTVSLITLGAYTARAVRARLKGTATRSEPDSSVRWLAVLSAVAVTLLATCELVAVLLRHLAPS